MLGMSGLNKLDATTKGTKRFSSALAVLGMLQLQDLGLPNRLVPLVLVSNYYLYNILLVTVVHNYTYNTTIHNISLKLSFIEIQHTQEQQNSRVSEGMNK